MNVCACAHMMHAQAHTKEKKEQINSRVENIKYKINACVCNQIKMMNCFVYYDDDDDDRR